MKKFPGAIVCTFGFIFTLLAAQPALAGKPSRDVDAGWIKHQPGDKIKDPGGPRDQSGGGDRTDKNPTHGNDETDVCRQVPGDAKPAHKRRADFPEKHRHNDSGKSAGTDADDCADDDIPDAVDDRPDKISICHVPPGNPGRAHTIVVGAAARDAHLAHGDYDGACADSGGECPVAKPDRAWWGSARLGGVKQYRQCLDDCDEPRGTAWIADPRVEKRQCRVDCAQLPPPLPVLGDADNDLRQCIEDCRIGENSVWDFSRKGRFNKRLVNQCVALCRKDACVVDGNIAPVADAGPDQSVELGAEVTLDGSASSDANGDPLTYLWTIVDLPAGSAALLSDATAVLPTFIADLDGEYRFDLVVNDGELDSDPDQVSIVTGVQNSPPLAVAGMDQAILVGETVFLDGSGSSDADGDELTYDWTIIARPAGSAASLSDPGSATPEFIADRPGQYRVQLVVDDGQASSAPDTVVASTINTRPIADAGLDVTAPIGAMTLLSGAGSSDAEGDPLSYSWSLTTRPPGSQAQLSDANSLMPGLVTDLGGIYVAQLIVNDGQLDSLPDTVVARAIDNQSPTAILIPRDLAGETLPNGRVPVGEDFLLDGSSSIDPEGEIARYAWTYLEFGVTVETETPAIPASLLTASELLPPGQHQFQLVVSDTSGNESTPATASVIVFDSFPPTAVLVASTLGGQPLPNGRLPFGADFLLDGSSSVDTEGDIIRYTWTYPATGATAQTEDSSIPASRLVGPAGLPLGQHQFQLEVSDASGNQSTPAFTSVTVFDSSPPSAVLMPLTLAGQPLTNGLLPIGDDFLLDGSSSFDADGDIVRYHWTYPATGATAQTEDSSIPASLLVGSAGLPLGQHQFQLEVSDASGNQSTPAFTSVIVFDPFPPTAVLRSLDLSGNPLVDSSIAEGENFQLDGSQSFDNEGNVSVYRWTHADSGRQILTEVATIDVTLLFDGQLPEAGEQVFLLQVTDASGNLSSPAQILVNIIADVPPVAVARALDAAGVPVPPREIVFFESPFFLDGSASFDNGGEVVSYAWTWPDANRRVTTDQPTIDSALLVGPGFLPIGEYEFELVVTDNTGNESDVVTLDVIIDREPD